jgi:negative regulator of flagellin synthesis FlgM
VADRIKGLDSAALGASGSGTSIEQIRASTALGGSSSNNTPQPTVDSVNITASARRMFALAQAVSEAPEVDTQRVSALQQSISNGQYVINPDRIANRLLQMEQDLAVAQ